MEIICRQLLTKGMSSDWVIGEYEPFQELDVECKLAPEEFVAAAEREIVWINLLINQAKAEMGQEQETVSDEV